MDIYDENSKIILSFYFFHDQIFTRIKLELYVVLKTNIKYLYFHSGNRYILLEYLQIMEF